MNIIAIQLVLVRRKLGLVVMCKYPHGSRIFWMHALILLSLAATYIYIYSHWQKRRPNEWISFSLFDLLKYEICNRIWLKRNEPYSLLASTSYFISCSIHTQVSSVHARVNSVIFIISKWHWECKYFLTSHISSLIVKWWV